jgi:hypothetical protein
LSEQLERQRSLHPQTDALLKLIVEEIEQLEVAAKGKWHNNLTAWAAVSEMLAHVLDLRRPPKDNPFSDEVVIAAEDKSIAAREARRAIVDELDSTGLSVKEDPRPKISLGQRRSGTLGSGGPELLSREWEKAALHALPEPERAKATPLFEALRSADAEVDHAFAEWVQAMRPYWEAEEQGRRIARTHLTKNAKTLAELARAIGSWS